MKCNIAVWDRVLRFIFGVIFLAFAVAGGPFWSWIGIYLIFTAAWGFCFGYAFLKVKTLREGRRKGVST